MPTTDRQAGVIDAVLFTAVAAIAAVMPFVPVLPWVRVMIGTASAAPTAALYVRRRAVFVPALFFCLHSILGPIALALSAHLRFEIPQVYFLPAIVVFGIVVSCSPQLKRHLGWARIGSFNKTTILLGVVLVAGSAVALIAWASFVATDLSRFQAFVPTVSMPVLIVYGVLFALWNSLVEEFMARANLYDAYAAIFSGPVAPIVFQALFFALWHFNGFPGGIVGVAMVFVWSVFLGTMRHTSGGIVAPFVAHFFADVTIALILLFRVVLPGMRAA